MGAWVATVHITVYCPECQSRYQLHADLLEHTGLVTRIGDLRLKRIIFRRASRTHGYFLSSNAHARLDTFHSLGIPVYWYDEMTKDLYLHTYRRDHGFFVFFAPLDKPQLAGVIFGEHAEHGSWTSPIAKHVIETYLAKRDGRPLPVLPVKAVVNADPEPLTRAEARGLFV